MNVKETGSGNCLNDRRPRFFVCHMFGVQYRLRPLANELAARRAELQALVAARGEQYVTLRVR
eukprot:2889043-Prymnesium_polylepis.1